LAVVSHEKAWYSYGRYADDVQSTAAKMDAVEDGGDLRRQMRVRRENGPSSYGAGSRDHLVIASNSLAAEAAECLDIALPADQSGKNAIFDDRNLCIPPQGRPPRIERRNRRKNHGPVLRIGGHKECRAYRAEFLT